MFLGCHPLAFAQIWRAVQQANIVSCSLNSSQISSGGSKLRVKSMSCAGARSMAMYGDKRKKVQNSIWRPVNARSHSPDGKRNEDTDNHIKSVQREYSKVENTKRWIVVNDNRKLSDSNVASISEVQNSRQDVENKSEAVAELLSTTNQSFITVKHVKFEDSVKCVKPNQEGPTLEPITLPNLEDVPKQQESFPESEASEKSVKESQGSVIIELSTTDHEKDCVEGKKQQREADTYSKILQNCTSVEESVESSRHSSTIKVDAALLHFVKGKGGKVQQKIEDTTGVKLSFISTEDENAVVVDGPSIKSVTAAASIIQNVLDEAVKGPNLQYSHFISLPLAVHPALVEKLTNFQNSILALSGCDDEEFIDPESAATLESSEDDSEEFYEGQKVAVNLNVEDDSEDLKVEMFKIQRKNEVFQIPRSFSGAECTRAHPADEVSDVKEAVAVKVDVEDGNVHVKMDLEGVSIGDTQEKTQTFYSQAKKSIKMDLEGVSTGDIQAKTKTFYSQAKKKLGIDKTIFIKPATFHLTVLMLKLWNKERVVGAAEVLQKVSSQVKEALKDRPVAVSLKGLEIMRGKPEKAHVLYVPVEEVGGRERLRHACRIIIDAFVESGLVMQKDASSTLKLHATLMNTNHRKMKNSRRYRRNFPFNAQRVMELYDSENWGEYVIHEAHLSQRFKYDDNGYYYCCSTIPFPEINKESRDGTVETSKKIVEASDAESVKEIDPKECIICNDRPEKMV